LSLVHSAPPSTYPFPYATLFRSDAGSTTELHEQPGVAIAQREQPLGGRVVASEAAGEHVHLPADFEQAREPRAKRHLGAEAPAQDRKSTRLNSSHVKISYAVFCL